MAIKNSLQQAAKFENALEITSPDVGHWLPTSSDENFQAIVDFFTATLDNGKIILKNISCHCYILYFVIYKIICIRQLNDIIMNDIRYS